MATAKQQAAWLQQDISLAKRERNSRASEQLRSLTQQNEEWQERTRAAEEKTVREQTTSTEMIVALRSEVASREGRYNAEKAKLETTSEELSTAQQELLERDARIRKLKGDLATMQRRLVQACKPVMAQPTQV